MDGVRVSEEVSVIRPELILGWSLHHLELSVRWVRGLHLLINAVMEEGLGFTWNEILRPYTTGLILELLFALNIVTLIKTVTNHCTTQRFSTERLLFQTKVHFDSSLLCSQNSNYIFKFGLVSLESLTPRGFFYAERPSGL